MATQDRSTTTPGRALYRGGFNLTHGGLPVEVREIGSGLIRLDGPPNVWPLTPQDADELAGALTMAARSARKAG